MWHSIPPAIAFTSKYYCSNNLPNANIANVDIPNTTS